MTNRDRNPLAFGEQAEIVREPGEKSPALSWPRGKKPWYHQAFQEDYLEIYMHRNLSEAARAVGFLNDILHLNPTHRLLDLCCGPGRHLVYLGRRVGQAVGLDLSRALLQRASRHWHDSNKTAGETSDESCSTAPLLIQGDMRRLPLEDASFDRVVNLFTSFGYFESEADNFAVLREVSRLLKPDGHDATRLAPAPGLFVIDHINREALLAGLKPQTERMLPQGRRLVEKRRWDAAARRVIKDVICSEPSGQVRAWTESVRVYEPVELEAMMTEAGLRTLMRYGDYGGDGWQADSPRLILLVQKV
jgi:SAM-dependent methyltransferase